MMHKHIFGISSKRGFAAIAIGAALMMGGCETSNGFNPAATGEGEFSNLFVSEFAPVSQAQVAVSADADIFKIGDTIEVDVYNVENLSGVYVVDRSGNVVLPLIGTTTVAGKSTFEVQEDLVQRYGENYLQNPGISVKIESKTLGNVVVDGAVNKPGVYEVFKIIPLSEAIARAEGLDEDANGKEVYIVRTVEGKRQVLTANLRAIRLEGAADPQVIPDDIVFVQDSRGRVIFREFLRTVPLLNTAIIYSTRTP